MKFSMAQIAGLPDLPSSRAVAPLLGRKTDAREHSSLRFSQELRDPLIFRRQMAPQKHARTAPIRLIQETARGLENAHLDTRMPPSVHVAPEFRRRRQRFPALVHGTFYRRPPPRAREAPARALTQALEDRAPRGGRQGKASNPIPKIRLEADGHSGVGFNFGPTIVAD
jgi:hypothetical protein